VSRVPSHIRVGLYTSSLGNRFFNEYTALLAAGLRHWGADVCLLDENSQRPADLALECVVAPHEFFYLGQGPLWAAELNLDRLVLVTTEQMHTGWFASTLPYLARAPLILDIHLQTAEGMRSLGLPAHFLPLGYLPDYLPFAAKLDLPNIPALRSLPPRVRSYTPSITDAFRDRPIDVLFVGGATERRRRFFATSSTALSPFWCFLFMPEKGPYLASDSLNLGGDAIVGLSQRSKILLNLHRTELSYFEFERIVHHGIWQRTLVVTEPCTPVPGFRAGEHFIQSSLEDMPDMLRFLLTTEEGATLAESVRQRAYDALVRDVRLDTTLAALGPLLLAGEGTPDGC
jgi:hypothetical protein